jgi:hypothetical protein
MKKRLLLHYRAAIMGHSEKDLKKATIQHWDGLITVREWAVKAA